MLGFNFNPVNLKLKVYDYGKLYNEISNDDFDDHDEYKEDEFLDISDIPPLEGDEKKVKERKRLKNI